MLRLATPERLRALIGENLGRLAEVLRFNVDHDIRLFRLSSNVIPFGSHPANGVPWWEEFADELAALGNLIRGGGLRTSVHPGQYTVLSSPDPRVTTAAANDLVYHARLLDALALDSTHKIVVHGGGVYGDKAAAIARWVEHFRGLPENVQSRLLIENDERLFGADDVLRLSALTEVPVVFDVLHHRVYAGDGADLSLPAALRAAGATWDGERDGVPKIHYSSQAGGRRPGAHAEYVDPDEFAAFLAAAPADLPFDCMLEAKAKDFALFRLREALHLTA